MKKNIFLILFSGIAFIFLTSYRQSEDDSMANLYVVFAGVSSNFNQLDSVAKKISTKTGIKYQTDLVYDKKRGMILPDTSSDEIYAGTYYPRRFAEERISIEMAGYYKTGDLRDADSTLMTLVTGIFVGKKEAAANLLQVKKNVPDAYMKKVKLYQGCMH